MQEGDKAFHKDSKHFHGTVVQILSDTQILIKNSKDEFQTVYSKDYVTQEEKKVEGIRIAKKYSKELYLHFKNNDYDILDTWEKFKKEFDKLAGLSPTFSKKSKFDDQFSHVVNFVPDGYYLSKNLFTKEEALIEFQETLGKEIKIDEISEQYVRFQPTPEELRGELDTKMA
jgi:hypothetical protein